MKSFLGQHISTDLIRVAIADGQPMVRSGLRYFLLAFDDLELVGEASDLKETVELCAKAHPDVLLIDVSLPGLEGLTSIGEFRGFCPETQIVALTSFEAELAVQDALGAEAISFVLKNASAEELANAIRCAHAAPQK